MVPEEILNVIYCRFIVTKGNFDWKQFCSMHVP